jgi:hypothetical protein
MSAIVTLPMFRALVRRLNGAAAVAALRTFLESAWNLVRALEHTPVREVMLLLARLVQHRDPANAKRLRRAAYESWME